MPPITTAAPLLFVLGVSGAREALEDYGRHKSDAYANSLPAHLLRGGRFVDVPTADLRVGDVVRVLNGEVGRVCCCLCVLLCDCVCGSGCVCMFI